MAVEEGDLSKQSSRKPVIRPPGLHFDLSSLLPTSGPTHESPTPSPLYFHRFGPLPSRRRWIYATFILLTVTYLVFSPQLIWGSWRNSSINSAYYSQFQWKVSQFTPGKFVQAWQGETIVNGEIHMVPGIHDLWNATQPPENSTIVTQEFPVEKEPRPSQVGSFRKPDEPHLDQSPEEAQSKLSIVQMQSPGQPFSSLPLLKLQPHLKYENVTPRPHGLPDNLQGQKFVTFLIHSGFHNQRISIINAFKVAKLLNRTLILPEIRLGEPITWKDSQSLSETLENDMKNPHFACVDENKEIPQPLVSKECQKYATWSPVQVDYMLDIQKLVEEQPVISRQDMRDEWLWEALKLSPGDWYAIEDRSRYDYQIFESKTIQGDRSSKYSYRLDIEDLKEYKDVKLLSFGSLFGSHRVITQSPEMKRWNKKLGTNQMPNVPVLDSISDQIAQVLGGRGNYVGLHLRVGNYQFKTQAPKSMRLAFLKLCREILHLEEEVIQLLFKQHDLKLRHPAKGLPRRKSGLAEIEGYFLPRMGKSLGSYAFDNSRDSHVMERGVTLNKVKTRDSWLLPASRSTVHQLDQVSKKESDFKPPQRKCRRSLHTLPQLQRLNVPIYIATDVINPELNRDLSIFYDSFPCIFSYQNVSGIGEKSLGLLRSSNDGLLLKPFLEPLLEAIVASKGSGFVGTPGSTFSSYAQSVLHPTYSKQVSESITNEP